MRKTILILIAFLFFTNLFSQDALLNTFKYRVDHYRAISFNFGSGGQWSELAPAVGKITNSSSFGNFNGTYYRVTSTDKRLSTIFSNIGSGFGSSHSNH